MPFCLTWPCGNDALPGKSRCAEHLTERTREKERTLDDRGTGRRADKRYGLRRWQLTRRIVLARDVWCCACEHAKAVDVDHIRPPRDGGAFWDVANLQGLCHRCHASKTNEETRSR